MYVIMITMVIVIINNLIGAYGIIWERSGLILTNSILLGISFILQLIAQSSFAFMELKKVPFWSMSSMKSSSNWFTDGTMILEHLEFSSKSLNTLVVVEPMVRMISSMP